MKKIKLLLVDDHKLMLRGLCAIMAGHTNIEVVGTASSGEEAINMVSSLRPDIVIMDILLPGMSGIEACRWIKERHEQVGVILLSMEIKKDYLTAGIQSGISGYLPKDIDEDVLIDAIENVSEGKQFFTEAVTKIVFEDFYQREKNKKSPKSDLPDDLTKREFEILQAVAQGKTNKQVAECLFISVKTVETHKSHILEKLGLRTSADLMMYAVKRNLVQI